MRVWGWAPIRRGRVFFGGFVLGLVLVTGVAAQEAVAPEEPGDATDLSEADGAILGQSDACRDAGRRWTGIACTDRSAVTGLWATRGFAWRERFLTVAEGAGGLLVRVDDLSAEGIARGTEADRRAADISKWRPARPDGEGIWRVDATGWGFEAVSGLTREAITEITLSLLEGGGLELKPNSVIEPGYIYTRLAAIADIRARDRIDLDTGILIEPRLDLGLVAPQAMAVTLQYKPAITRGMLVQSRGVFSLEASEHGIAVNGRRFEVRAPVDPDAWYTIALSSRGVLTEVRVLGDPDQPPLVDETMTGHLAFAPGAPLRIGLDGFASNETASGALRHLQIWRTDLGDTDIRRIAARKPTHADPISRSLAWTDFGVVHPAMGAWAAGEEVREAVFDPVGMRFGEETLSWTAPNTYTAPDGAVLRVGAETLEFRDTSYRRKGPYDDGVFFIALTAGDGHLTDEDTLPVTSVSGPPDYEFGLTDSAEPEPATGYTPVMMERILGYAFQKWQLEEDADHPGFYRIGPLGRDEVLTFSFSTARFQTTYIRVPTRNVEVTEIVNRDAPPDRRRHETRTVELGPWALAPAGVRSPRGAADDIVHAARHITLAPRVESGARGADAQLFRVMDANDGAVYLQARTSVLGTEIPSTALIHNSTGWSSFASATTVIDEVVSVPRIANKFEDAPGTIRISRDHTVTTAGLDPRYVQRFRLIPAPETRHRPDPIGIGELVDRMDELGDRMKVFLDLRRNPDQLGEILALAPPPGSGSGADAVLRAFNTHVGRTDLSTAGPVDQRTFESLFFNPAVDGDRLGRIYDDALAGFTLPEGATAADLQAVKRYLSRLMLYRSGALAYVDGVRDALLYYRIEALQTLGVVEALLESVAQGDEPCAGDPGAPGGVCSVFLRDDAAEAMMGDFLPRFLTGTLPAAIAPADGGVTAAVVSTIVQMKDLVDLYRREKRLETVAATLGAQVIDRSRLDYAAVRAVLDREIRTEFNTALRAVERDLKAFMLFDPHLLEALSAANDASEISLRAGAVTTGPPGLGTLTVPRAWADLSDEIARNLTAHYLRALLPARAAVLGYTAKTLRGRRLADRAEELARLGRLMSLGTLNPRPLSSSSRLASLDAGSLVAATITDVPLRLTAPEPPTPLPFAEDTRLPERYQIQAFHLVVRPANGHFREFTPAALDAIRAALGPDGLMEVMAPAIRIACDLRPTDDGWFDLTPAAQGASGDPGHWVPLTAWPGIAGFGDLTGIATTVEAAATAALPPIVDDESGCTLMRSATAIGR